MTTKTALLKRIEALEHNLNNQIDYSASLAENLANALERIMVLEDKLKDMPTLMTDLFDETAAKMSREWSDGLNSVLDFNPMKG